MSCGQRGRRVRGERHLRGRRGRRRIRLNDIDENTGDVILDKSGRKPHGFAGGGNVDQMYENYRLCDKLKPREICFVVEQYDQGKFHRQFHQHVRESRLSDDSRSNLLRALVIKFSAISAEMVVRCHLNEKGKHPADKTSLSVFVTHPERGVRRSCCGTNTKAWSDEVDQPNEFRQDA